jgi:hypothetical protein
MKLTANELKLFTSLGFNPSELEIMQYSFNPMDSYKWAVETVFLKDLKGPAVEALRRGYRALMIQGQPRNTPEFEELIQWEDKKHGSIKITKEIIKRYSNGIEQILTEKYPHMNFKKIGQSVTMFFADIKSEIPNFSLEIHLGSTISGKGNHPASSNNTILLAIRFNGYNKVMCQRSMLVPIDGEIEEKKFCNKLEQVIHVFEAHNNPILPTSVKDPKLEN